MNRTEVAWYWEANAQTWTRHSRAGYDTYRDGLNTPAFLDMLPPVRGLCGIDIGCGEGSNTRQLARLGANMHAVDLAPTFIRHAQEAEQAEPRDQNDTGQGIEFAFEAAGTLVVAGKIFAVTRRKPVRCAARGNSEILELAGFWIR